MKMNEMIKSFPDQIIDQFENLNSLHLSLDKFSNVDTIVIAGMGGSAISGDLVKLFLKNDIDVPITVLRDYSIPNWTNENTLPTATQTGAGAGIKTAALCIGGNTAADGTEDQTLEWYGTGLYIETLTTTED